jgi:hypothetical protein
MAAAQLDSAPPYEEYGIVYRPQRMKFGIFMAPFQRAGENPTLALKRDLQLIQHLDALGFDEAWIGEYHSYDRELIADPAVFIAAAAERTRRIRLGTGVTSLSYHHPLIVADTMVQLDQRRRRCAATSSGHATWRRASRTSSTAAFAKAYEDAGKELPAPLREGLEAARRA